MSRRAITYVALLVTSVVISACSQPMGPRREDSTITCPDGRTIYVLSGRTCSDQ